MANKNIIIAILFCLTSGLAGFSIAPDSAVGGGIQSVKIIIQETMKHKMKELADKIKELTDKVDLNSEFRVDEYIKLITKNAKKIVSDPDDIKRTDIDLCISYLGKIPEERKTESVKFDIDLILKWNHEHP